MRGREETKGNGRSSEGTKSKTRGKSEQKNERLLKSSK